MESPQDVIAQGICGGIALSAGIGDTSLQCNLEANEAQFVLQRDRADLTVCHGTWR
jgi:hypothetical protein